MKRNIVKHGPATLTISLPISWVKKNNLKPGASLDVEEKGNQLIVNTKKQDDFVSLTIDIKNNYKTGLRYINSAYRKGCDELKIYYDDSLYLKKIERCLLEDILGFQIINQGKESNKNFCVLRDIPGTKFDEFDSLLKRIWIIIISLSEDVLEAFEKNNKKIIEGFDVEDKKINKFTNFCIRVLNKRGHPKYKNIPVYYRFLRCLEELSDYYKYFAVYYCKRDLKLSNDFIEILKKINESLRLLYKSFYKPDDKNIELLFSQTLEIYSLIRDEPNSELNHYLFSINNKIRSMISAIIEMEILED